MMYVAHLLYHMEDLIYHNLGSQQLLNILAVMQSGGRSMT